MPWIQSYTPIAGSLGMSALVAAIPLVVIFMCLAVMKMKAHKAALLAVASAFAIAVTVWGMPAKLTALAFGQGAGFGLPAIVAQLLQRLLGLGGGAARRQQPGRLERGAAVGRDGQGGTGKARRERGGIRALRNRRRQRTGDWPVPRRRGEALT